MSAGTEDVLPVRDVAMDGAIVYSCSPNERSVEWLRRRRLPLVLVDQPGAGDLPSINIDDRSGARAAAAHVVGLGHRRVAILTAGPAVFDAPDDWFVVQERMRGWRDALAAAGVEPVVRHVEKSVDEQSSWRRCGGAGPVSSRRCGTTTCRRSSSCGAARHPCRSRTAPSPVDDRRGCRPVGQLRARLR